MHADRQRFEKGAKLERQRLRQFHHLVDRYLDVFGHRAVAIDADQLERVAHVRVTIEARFAVPAREQRINRHRRPRRQRRMAGNDRPRKLVAHHQRRFGARVNPLIDVHVGTANADIRHFDQDLACPNFRQRLLFDANVLRAAVYDAFHERFLKLMRTC